MQFPTVAFQDQEVRTGVPDADTVERIVSLFQENGAVRMLNLLPAEFAQRLRAHYLARYRLELAGTTKEDRRPLYSVDLDGPVAEPT